MIIEWIHYCTGASHSMWVNESSGLLCKGFRFSVFLIHQNWSLDSLAKGGGSLINYQIGSLYWLMRKAHLYALAAGVKTIHSKYLKCCICGALHSGNNNQQPAPRSARQQLFYFFLIFHASNQSRYDTSALRRGDPLSLRLLRQPHWALNQRPPKRGQNSNDVGFC